MHSHKDPDGGAFRTLAPTYGGSEFGLPGDRYREHDRAVWRRQGSFRAIRAATSAQRTAVRGACKGIPVEEQDLIELVAPVYGLDDAPLRWFKAVTAFLRKIGHRRSLLDPCVYIRQETEESNCDEDKTARKIKGVILIEVDDFCMGFSDEKVQRGREAAGQEVLFWQAGVRRGGLRRAAH